MIYKNTMNTKILFGICTLLLIIGIGLYTYSPIPPDTTSVSNANDTAIRATVTEFGTKLKNVSLLAPNASSTLATEYGSYIAPELLAKWQQNPNLAIGRQTSSPWPESIDVVSVTPLSESTYTVEANVIEVTNASPREPAAVYPITITIQKIAEKWLVTSLSRGAYSELPKRTTIVGTWECLPHKDSTGPQTMECAFGIAEEKSGAHYAIDTRLMAQYPVDYPTGTRLRVSGTITPVEYLSSIQKYDIKGIISATEITKL